MAQLASCELQLLKVQDAEMADNQENRTEKGKGK